tara:strand:+ start:104 stop:355 length:252 start_codon:yes stop_codon:yes gene_type:complete
MARANAETIAHAPDRLAMRVYFARWAVLNASRASPRRITARSNTARSRFFPFLSHPGGGVFKNAALQVLRTERRLMSTGEVTR